MSLTSSSTYSDAVDQYLDNLDWDGDVTKARAALQAIRFLCAQRPLRQTSADGRSIDFESLAPQQKQIERFLDVYDSTNRPTHSFVQGRPLM